ncbi:MAG: helix-turn-helix transcriptional regulator [Ruminococcaceae bacterium]|nr:helix-turn-helix transcriptional regulator [Oscillospiraceae bacterium]
MEHDHHNMLEKVKTVLPSDAQLCDLADLYKLFADSTRVKILFSLLQEELCVCAICELLNMEQSAISHQLKKLRLANMVKSRREGKTVLYSLADSHVRSIIALGFEHLTEGES